MSSAFADQHACGQYITQDTTLHTDILGCQGNGIVIGADNITLDLNGHTISGNGFNYGVFSYDHSGVVIENGTIRSFYQGVGLDEGTGNIVRNVTGEFNSAAAVSVYESNNNLVEGNTSISSNSGVVVTEGEGNVIRNNSIRRGAGIGIYLLEFSNENLVERNNVSLMFSGALLFDSDHNHFSRNTFTENGLGIWLLGADGADDNVFDRNVMLLNGSDGMRVELNSTGAVIDRNEANQNRDDGIDINDPTATLARNTANVNGDHGIEAVAGVTDGGGNRASGNGDPVQCQVVVCK